LTSRCPAPSFLTTNRSVPPQKGHGPQWLEVLSRASPDTWSSKEGNSDFKIEIESETAMISPLFLVRINPPFFEEILNIFGAIPDRFSDFQVSRAFPQKPPVAQRLHLNRQGFGDRFFAQ
jgi:hypothetical protein